MWARMRHRGGLADRAPFRRIASRGKGHPEAASSFSRFPPMKFFELVAFRDSLPVSRWKNRQGDSVTAAAVEQGSQLAGQTFDDPLKLVFAISAGSPSGTSATGHCQRPDQFAFTPKRDFDRILRVPKHGEFNDLGDQERRRDCDVLGR